MTDITVDMRMLQEKQCSVSITLLNIIADFTQRQWQVASVGQAVGEAQGDRTPSTHLLSDG